MSTKLMGGIIKLPNITVQMGAYLSGRSHEKVEDNIEDVMYKEELKTVTKSEEINMTNSRKCNENNYSDLEEIMEVDLGKRHLIDQYELELLENELINHNNHRCEGKGVVTYIEW